MTILNPLAPPTAQGHPNGESPAVGEPADGRAWLVPMPPGSSPAASGSALGGRPTSGPPIPGRSNLGLPLKPVQLQGSGSLIL